MHESQACELTRVDTGAEGVHRHGRRAARGARCDGRFVAEYDAYHAHPAAVRRETSPCALAPTRVITPPRSTGTPSTAESGVRARCWHPCADEAAGHAAERDAACTVPIGRRPLCSLRRHEPRPCEPSACKQQQRSNLRSRPRHGRSGDGSAARAVRTSPRHASTALDLLDRVTVHKRSTRGRTHR